jgi:hypothetical protein
VEIIQENLLKPNLAIVFQIGSAVAGAIALVDNITGLVQMFIIAESIQISL